MRGLLEPKSRERERNAWKRGRRQAIDEAVMPMPGSTVDQMATSVFLNRKSLPVPISKMKGMRIMVAVEPL
jgi:hypothetical protein